MSVRQVQIKNLLDLITQSHFVGGVNPQLNDVLQYMSMFFAKYPPGTPLRMERDLFDQVVSDPEVINDLMAKAIFNIDVLYETCLQHLDELTILNTVLRTHLERLKIKRINLESRVDDYLLGSYNSDGYFYSISDQFTDTGLIDLDLTSCFVDTDSGALSLPMLSNLSKRVDVNRIDDPTFDVRDSSGNALPYEVKAPFSNAVDGLTNSAWFVNVESSTIQPISMTVRLNLAVAAGGVNISRIDVTPFGVTPVQVGISVLNNKDVYSSDRRDFTSVIKTSTEKMTFIGEQIEDSISTVQLLMVKRDPDFTRTTSSGVTHIYQFGLKELALSEHVYDQLATFVSKPISLPTALGNDSVIDAVSLTVEEVIPSNTSIKYYVATDVPNADSLSDFFWREIQPIGGTLADTANQIVSFDGSIKVSKMIRQEVELSSDLQMIAPNTTADDLSKRNPSPSILVGADAYRIAEFDDLFLSDSLLLEEGINTTKIYYTDLDELAVNEGFEFWKDKFEDPTSYFTAYGRIDAGHEFFYGGDVGESGKSVFVETYVEVLNDLPVLLKECTKVDTNSRTWDMRVFLNGKEIANMPVGVNRITVPWKFTKGRNHVAILANIPEATLEYPSPYIGTVSLMTDDNLDNFGTVKLNTWTYVDLFKFQNNQVNEPNSFTIYNKEIISRKKPTDNFRLTYAKSSSSAPYAIRLRADMTRSSYYQKATPLLDSYRLRFSYK